jgi:hypothetical protein
MQLKQHNPNLENPAAALDEVYVPDSEADFFRQVIAEEAYKPLDGKDRDVDIEPF